MQSIMQSEQEVNAGTWTQTLTQSHKGVLLAGQTLTQSHKEVVLAQAAFL